MAKRKRGNLAQLAKQQNTGDEPGDPVEAAREYGIDIGLLVDSLRLTPGERLARLDEQVAALRELRHAARRAGLSPDGS